MKKRTVRTFMAGVIAGAALMCAAGFSYAALTKIDVRVTPVSFVMEGQKIQPSDKEQQYFNGKSYIPVSFVYKDTTYVPLRLVSEKLGHKVGYDPATHTIYLGKEKGDGKELKFKTIYPSGGEQPQLSSRIQRWFDDHKKQEFMGTMCDEDGMYAMVARGEQPNGGYGIEIVGVTEYVDEIVVKVRHKNPEPGKMYTQVITYPTTLVKMPCTDKKIRFEIVNDIHGK
ncbi:protease complex subunit PrcB family protein [Aneurinibacillus thermoaerophilus]|uniref:Copper amine oxidase N-terminal domain-containing protein n=1 Tax=Aneurinibacillus thermoaerophilus TaxID=143495 RepID=A0A1G8A6K6_ANETH|nr:MULTISPECIES: protease complex subunit PrcB family protein [Aneurinibacillus]AMA74086.1 hypothetical protein ACH33_15520 [Aneurinibacillus sp. XH2]MED0758344.1 protease complex subunit PrcB family protein [Aneurinibacillus thermoaerophilus]MED0759849.1 protease complex subunit PrcB family protein [Aneurinibacillus thermoaerophilus]SDH16558.1 Copper amine oxidase N-terminal domain-containing protein [Aneurinibacillus thermoaerophilus]